MHGMGGKMGAEYHREYRRKNLEKLKAKQREYYESNRDRILAVNAEYRRNNPDKCAEISAEYAKNNRERVRSISRKWKSSNKSKVTADTSLRRARLAGVDGRYSPLEWLGKLEEFNNTCPACGASDRLTADHIVPVSWGGSNWIENIQPLCSPCNSRKNSREISEYAPWTGEPVLLNYVDGARRRRQRTSAH